MPYVLADQRGWLSAGSEPFENVVLGDFKSLRNGVNGDKADYFMWEHFTTKKFYDSGELKRVGEIYTPWSSWVITARDATDKRLEAMAESLNKGIERFREQRAEAVEHITSTMEYSKEDAEAWMETVKFSDDVRGLDPATIDKTIEILRKAGVLREKAGSSADMIAIPKSSRGST